MKYTWLEKSRLYLQLFRLQTGAATAFVPVLGAIATGIFTSYQLVFLFIIGLMYHIFGFVLNEYIDIKIDSIATDLQAKPLVSGKISSQHALIISGSAIIIGILSIIIIFQNRISVLFFIIAVSLGAMYDIWGKKVYGLDFALGAGFSFLVLCGARTSIQHMTLIPVLISIVLGLQIVFNNAIEGGLKDVKNDREVGAKTLAQRLGVNATTINIIISWKFIGFAILLRILFFLILGYIFITLSYSSVFLILVLSLIMSGIIIWSMWLFLGKKLFNRSRLKRIFSIHEISSYMLLIFVLSPFVSVILLIVLVLVPIIWYIVFNLVLYGYVLEPQV